MSLTLDWRGVTSLPVDGAPLRPGTFLDLSADQASRTPLRVGNTTADLAELFRVQGIGGDYGSDHRG